MVAAAELPNALMPLGNNTSIPSFGIIGGGWYGCHIAITLRSLGFKVRVFEQHSRLLHEASGNNQCRLHMGFHYARHSDTRVQSREGFLRFIERYPDLSREIPCNIYAVPTRESLIDYDTYRTIMAFSGMHFTEGTPAGVLTLANVDGAICTTERVILLSKARAYFEAELDGLLELGHPVSQVRDIGDNVFVDDKKFDYVVDATWGHYSSPSIPVIYEPTLLLFYQGPPDFPAVTLVDGPLCSIFPTEMPGLFTLSSVPYTPLGHFATSAEARVVRDNVDARAIAVRRTLMEEQISRYLPDFQELFHYVGPQLAIKTKATGAHDDRSCHVSQHGRVFSVMSGKIDTIFSATERIMTLMKTKCTNSAASSSIHDVDLKDCLED
ncbi:hypothetical protein NM208_g967 [Fusarium decemcellulare]|uniref:Uncharacterized protein n=1 Tax=Fusarium decemcellulare TaxID=57161 RepID=A0ACC1SXQ7_9HYPO|nr:hypothetical protein NM208_g967 [Fusarium decemcellulare]